MTGETFPCQRCARLAKALMAANLSRVEVMRERQEFEAYLEEIGRDDDFVGWRYEQRQRAAEAG